MKFIKPVLFGTAALALLVPLPSKAITFVWNGSGNYDCQLTAGACTVTATNFSLTFDTGTNSWSNAYGASGSLVLSNTLNATVDTYINNGAAAGTAPGVSFVPSPGGINNSQAFTISPYAANNYFYTFYLTRAVTGDPYEVASIYAIGTPSTNPDTSNSPNLDNTSLTSLITPTVFGQSAPAPLGLLAALPLVRLVRKRKHSFVL